MKIRQQLVDDFPFVPRFDEKVGPVQAWLDFSRFFIIGAFQCPDACSSCSDYRPSGLFGIIDELCTLCTYLEPFIVHVVVI